LTALLDTLKFFDAVEILRAAVGGNRDVVDARVSGVSRVARAFQHYRVPVVRIRKTGLAEAVEIFARLNSKGQAMAADQMVSALSYRENSLAGDFNLASGIDEIASMLGERGFEDFDRTAILRAILANIDQDIYKTDWTRMLEARRAELVPQLKSGVESALVSVRIAVEFLQEELRVRIGRLLPYAMQLVVLSAFFDVCPEPVPAQRDILVRWFWASSFGGWFGGANPSRVNALVAEFRELGRSGGSGELQNFDLSVKSLPYPRSFDMRSARTRTQLLVLLSLGPRSSDGKLIQEPWRAIAERGPDGVGYVIGSSTSATKKDPANRLIRPPEVPTGSLRAWIEGMLDSASDSVLESHALTREGVTALAAGNFERFIETRRAAIMAAEAAFRSSVGVTDSGSEVGSSPIDTE
jgi:hypothetical protein